MRRAEAEKLAEDVEALLEDHAPGDILEALADAVEESDASGDADVSDLLRGVASACYAHAASQRLRRALEEVRDALAEGRAGDTAGSEDAARRAVIADALALAKAAL